MVVFVGWGGFNDIFYRIVYFVWLVFFCVYIDDISEFLCVEILFYVEVYGFCGCNVVQGEEVVICKFSGEISVLFVVVENFFVYEQKDGFQMWDERFCCVEYEGQGFGCGVDDIVRYGGVNKGVLVCVGNGFSYLLGGGGVDCGVVDVDVGFFGKVIGQDGFVYVLDVLRFGQDGDNSVLLLRELLVYKVFFLLVVFFVIVRNVVCFRGLVIVVLIREWVSSCLDYWF